MENIGNEFIQVLQYLLPGFLAAWIFYGFTSYPTPSQFERIVQALIFTLFIQFCVYLEKATLSQIDDGSLASDWDVGDQLFAATITALAVGVAFAHGANTNWLHRLAYKAGITRETSYPSEWFGAFLNKECYLVLHLKSGGNLYGWLRVWPTDPREGHFLIEEPSWLTVSGEKELDGVESVLIDVKDVKWVEIMQPVERDDNGQNS